MVLRLFGARPWDVGTLTAPWGARPSIHGALAVQLRTADTSLYRAGVDLPDEGLMNAEGGFRWAAGASDGVLGHHAGDAGADGHARAVGLALAALVDRSTDERAAALYDLLTRHAALAYLDALLPTLPRTPRYVERARAIARWLATAAPDREPVKVAIGILGVVSDGSDRTLLLTLGRHEEFTLFCTAALMATEPEPDAVLWELATHVTGWGRIQIVERLAGTSDPRIQAWLLREGCRNDIMDEYTACTCARAGGLVEALRQPDPDEALLDGAGTILSALARGGPAESMADYVDGAEATERYLAHLGERDVPLGYVNLVAEIGDYVASQIEAGSGAAAGWPARAPAIQAMAGAFLARTDWPGRVAAGLVSADLQAFSTAAEAARRVGVDAWEAHFARLQHDDQQWPFVMQTTDDGRIDRVLAFAEATLPLDAIGSGPADELGLGPGFRAHRSLDWVLQGLRRIPGKGWPLLRTGLRSPVTRNRNMAVQALASWDRQSWPPEAELLMRQAVKAEPNGDTRSRMQALVEGRTPPQS